MDSDVSPRELCILVIEVTPLVVAALEGEGVAIGALSLEDLSFAVLPPELVVTTAAAVADVRAHGGVLADAPLLALCGPDEVALAYEGGADFVSDEAPSARLLTIVLERARALRAVQVKKREVATAVGQLAASVAHEVNNPLQFMLSGVEELSAVLRGRPELAVALGDVREGIERIRTTTRALSRLDPSVPLAMTSLAPISSSGPPSAVGRPRVLVIDDDASVARGFRRYLRGHEVTMAVGGREALARLREDHAYDAIVCDLVMPDVDGAMVYDAIQAEWPGLEQRVLFCSGGAYTKDAREFLERNHLTMLEKPVSAATLREAIRGVLAAAPRRRAGGSSP